MPRGRFTVKLAPESEPDTIAVGDSMTLRLGHCGLASPVDVDGSLWDPIHGHEADGGPISAEGGELVQERRVTFRLLEPNVAEISYRSGTVVTLRRNEGPRRYELCA